MTRNRLVAETLRDSRDQRELGRAQAAMNSMTSVLVTCLEASNWRNEHLRVPNYARNSRFNFSVSAGESQRRSTISAFSDRDRYVHEIVHIPIPCS